MNRKKDGDDDDDKEKEFTDYYAEDNYFVHVKCIYVDAKDRHVQGIKRDLIWMDQANIITREDLIKTIKNNYQEKGKKYRLLSLLLFNVDLLPKDVPLFVTSEDFEEYKCSLFFQSLTKVDAITLSPTISMFQTLNELIIVFLEDERKEPKKSSNGSTKKIIYLLTDEKKQTATRRRRPNLTIQKTSR